MRIFIGACFSIAMVGVSLGWGQGFQSPKQHTIIDGDTLWDLANKYYSDPYKWHRIYEANSQMINDPHWIYPLNIIVIPGLMEEIKPLEIKPEPEPEQVIVPEVVEKPPETVLPPPVEPEPEPAPPPRKPQVSKKIEPPDFSEEMPRDMKGGYPSLPTIVVAPGWKDDGKVTSTGGPRDFEGLAIKGDIVEVKLRSGIYVSEGELLNVYRRGTWVFDADGKKIGLELQKSAVLRVTAIGKKRVEAKVIKMNSAVEIGDVVKMDWLQE